MDRNKSLIKIKNVSCPQTERLSNYIRGENIEKQP